MDRHKFLRAMRGLVTDRGICLVVALGLFVVAAKRNSVRSPEAAQQAPVATTARISADRQLDRTEMRSDRTAGITVPGVTVPGITVPGVTVPGVAVPGVTVPGVTAASGLDVSVATVGHAGQAIAGRVVASRVNVDAVRHDDRSFGFSQPPDLRPVPVDLPPVRNELATASPSEPWPRVKPETREPWPRAESLEEDAWETIYNDPAGSAIVAPEWSIPEAAPRDGMDRRVENKQGRRDEPLSSPAGVSPEGSVLVERQPQRHDPMMHAVRLRADGLVREGFRLAERGMYASARNQFVQVLRTVSQALDAQMSTRTHSQALAAGLRALEEVDDFMPPGAQLEADLDLIGLISAHRTPVFKEVEPGKITPLSAQQSYFTFAQQQLAVAAGNEPAGSMALYGLARLESMFAKQNPHEYRTAGPKAMTMHQAALSVHQQNYLASNELGVLLARYGQFEQARRQFEHGVRLAPQGATWHNLATVYASLGQNGLAANARQQADILARRGRAAVGQAANEPQGVTWVNPETFARTGGATAAAPVRQAPAVLNPAKRQPTAPLPTEPNLRGPNLRGLDQFGWLPWKKSPR